METNGYGQYHIYCLFFSKIFYSKQMHKLNSSGMEPFFVCATAGTTVYGACDPLLQIADICDRHKLWFHVDVCFFS